MAENRDKALNKTTKKYKHYHIDPTTIGKTVRYKSHKDILNRINSYFDYCSETNTPLTMTGLGNALDISRQTLLNYKNKNRLYFDTVKKARLTVQQFYEEELHRHKNVAGIIFNLKNNFGWTNKEEVTHGGNITIQPITFKPLKPTSKQLEGKPKPVDNTVIDVESE